DRRRAVAAECSAGRELAADRDDIGQRLVEIAHLFGPHAVLPPTTPDSLCSTKYIEAQRKCKGAGASAHFPTSALHRRDTFSRTSESHGLQQIYNSSAAFDLKSLNPILAASESGTSNQRHQANYSRLPFGRAST